MKIQFWLDVYQWTNQSNLNPTMYPMMPKPEGCKRYMLTCEIPDFDADADQIITPEVKEEIVP